MPENGGGQTTGRDYAGDITETEAWQRLSDEQEAILVDVRTQFEWQFVGVPNLESLSKEPIYVEWVTGMGPNPGFLGQLQGALNERGADKDTPILFLCRSGARSKSAAIRLTELGYTACFNIEHGFEGDLDQERHRNNLNGWRVSGLPWKQS